MSNEIKHSAGPKTDKGKAISSRNSTTHSLTARRWLDANEQSLFDETVATIQRRVASLNSIFNLTKSTNPTKEPVVILTLKKLRRKFGKPRKQATPLTYNILTKLKNVCSNDIVGLRNKLLLQLGYESMRRRSEICQFTFEDLQHLGNHKHALILRHSKTNQYNQGKIIPISDELSEMISS